MTMKTGSDLSFVAGSWQEAAHDIYIGLLVGMGHVYKIFVQMPYHCIVGSPEQPRLQESGELKVVGVGFGRTGTVRLSSSSWWSTESIFVWNMQMSCWRIRYIYLAFNSPDPTGKSTFTHVYYHGKDGLYHYYLCSFCDFFFDPTHSPFFSLCVLDPMM